MLRGQGSASAGARFLRVCCLAPLLLSLFFLIKINTPFTMSTNSPFPFLWRNKPNLEQDGKITRTPSLPEASPIPGTSNHQPCPSPASAEHTCLAGRHRPAVGWTRTLIRAEPSTERLGWIRAKVTSARRSSPPLIRGSRDRCFAAVPLPSNQIWLPQSSPLTNAHKSIRLLRGKPKQTS